MGDGCRDAFARCKFSFFLLECELSLALGPSINVGVQLDDVMMIIETPRFSLVRREPLACISHVP